MQKPTHTIIGAGLVGSLLATLLAQRGFSVRVFERRPDPRKHGFLGGRSINLALAERGWHGLRMAGLNQRMQGIAVMMRGRMVHDLSGRTNLQRYGRDDSEVIWSVNRGDLNMALLDAAEAAGASIVFDQRLDGVDWQRSILTFRDGQNVPATHHARILIGADGAGSALRAAMASMADLGERFEPLGHGYKELEIPALTDFPANQLPEGLREAAARGERFAMEANALHIWPRGNYMCIALPNAHGSFTVTLFLPNEGEPSIASISDARQARAFFERDFADASALIPKLEEDFIGNPTGMLGTLYLDRWHIDGRALLVGDAAHAIVPFHGQGMNAGFEDAVELAELLEATPSDYTNVFAEFERRRKPNTDAIATMALENYIEMRDRVDDADYLLMRELDRTLAARHPGAWVPRYAMVTFSRIPYREAFERGAAQTNLLRELVTGKSRLDEVDMQAADARALGLIGK
ncbi:MAG: FAD-dependent monooxygenase [Dokdonella sp.]|nr:MAG: FAD-dependent monooxygenase [Gammaproteobacteria bacterium]TXI75417.1 MAG: FAD-dependent monooxygenase [Dokdonella sp.]